MASAKGIRLEFSDGHLPLTDVAEINVALAEIGTGVWPLDLSGEPDDIRRLLGQPTLTEAEAERMRKHFLLPRERLLEIIAVAGRKPNVPGGGELTTWVSNHGYSYPQLWIVQGDEDYTRFDRFHVNVSEDGIGVDEVLQMLWGGGLVIHHLLPSGVTLTMSLDCRGVRLARYLQRRQAPHRQPQPGHARDEVYGAGNRTGAVDNAL